MSDEKKYLETSNTCYSRSSTYANSVEIGMKPWSFVDWSCVGEPIAATPITS